MQIPFFVYGTLRTGHPAHSILEQYIEQKFDAYLPGFGLYVTVVPYIRQTFPGDRVFGELIFVDSTWYSTVLDNLDCLESFDERYENNRYIRAAFPIHSWGKHKVTYAWVYIAGPSVKLNERNKITGGDINEWRY